MIHLGCGLDFRHLRIPLAQCQWYDLDFPPVIALKQQLCSTNPQYHMIASSVTDPHWLDAIEDTPHPVLVIAEGLTMYLSQQEIDTLLCRIQQRFPQATYIFDVYSTLAVKLTQKKWNPLLNRTGATIQWGIDHPTDLEPLGLVYQKSLYLHQPKLVATIKNPYFRGMFRLTMKSKTVNQAMRILVYQSHRF